MRQEERPLARGPQIGLGGLRPRLTRQGYPSVAMKRLNRTSFADIQSNHNPSLYSPLAPKPAPTA